VLELLSKSKLISEVCFSVGVLFSTVLLSTIILSKITPLVSAL